MRGAVKSLPILVASLMLLTGCSGEGSDSPNKTGVRGDRTSGSVDREYTTATAEPLEPVDPEKTYWVEEIQGATDTLEVDCPGLYEWEEFEEGAYFVGKAGCKGNMKFFTAREGMHFELDGKECVVEGHTDLGYKEDSVVEPEWDGYDTALQLNTNDGRMRRMEVTCE